MKDNKRMVDELVNGFSDRLACYSATDESKSLFLQSRSFRDSRPSPNTHVDWIAVIHFPCPTLDS